MNIDRRLNFVVPIYGDPFQKMDEKGEPERDAGGAPVMITPVMCYVHSTPIGLDVAERYCIILAQVFAGIFNLGLGAAAGPGVAMKMLKKYAVRAGEWDDVSSGLVEEIRRLTSVVVPTPEGWRPVPLQVAVDTRRLDPEDRAEVENAIVFFICVCATLDRAQRRAMMQAACSLWSAQTSSSSATEFAASLPTSTGTASSGATAQTSQAPPHAPAAAPARTMHRPNATVDGRPSSVPH